VLQHRQQAVLRAQEHICVLFAVALWVLTRIKAQRKQMGNWFSLSQEPESSPPSSPVRCFAHEDCPGPSGEHPQECNLYDDDDDEEEESDAELPDADELDRELLSSIAPAPVCIATIDPRHRSLLDDPVALEIVSGFRETEDHNAQAQDNDDDDDKDADADSSSGDDHLHGSSGKRERPESEVEEGDPSGAQQQLYSHVSKAPLLH